MADISDWHVTALRSLTSIEVDMPGVTSFVCSMYGFTTSDINEARYKAFIRMSGGDEKYPLATIKKRNCASLPPCNKTLGNHVKRVQVVSMNLEESQSDGSKVEARPTEYGWKENNNRLEPDRFPGRSVPETLGATRRDDATTRMDDAASHIGDISTHADDERTERMTLMTTFFFFRVLHTIFSHLLAHAFARSLTAARSSAVQASSSRRQERRWAIVCGSPQSQSTDWASSR